MISSSSAASQIRTSCAVFVGCISCIREELFEPREPLSQALERDSIGISVLHIGRPNFGGDRVAFGIAVNRTYEEMAAHYGTAVVPARPRKPRDKAEVAVQIAQRWIVAR